MYWTDEEIEFLKNHYFDYSKEYILNSLNSDKNWESVKRKAFELNLKRKTNRITWSEEEDQLLREMYPSKSKTEILKNLPKRKWRYIRNRADKLGLVRDSSLVYSERASSWSSEEVAYLRNNYANAPKEEILSHIKNKSWGSIKAVASRHKLVRDCDSILKDKVRNKTASRPLWTEEEDLVIKEMYHSSSKEDILNSLPKRSWKSIRARALKLNIKRDSKKIKSEAQEKLKETNLKKYKVDNLFKDPSFQKKIRKSFKDKYQVDYPMQLEESKNKVKKNNLEKYGVEHYSQTEEFKNKVKKTSLDKYGVGNYTQTKECQDKISKTTEERYGVSNVFKSEEIKNKIKKTNLNKYGVENYTLTEEYKEKTKKSNLDKYGVSHPMKSEEIKSKVVETNLGKYGVDHPMKIDSVKDKLKNVFIDKYGVTNPAMLAEVKERIKVTNLEKYGVEYSLQNKEVREKGYQTAKERGSFTKSNSEMVFYDILKRNIDPDIRSQELHTSSGYVIDYYSPKYDLWIQYDGTYWHGKGRSLKDIKAKADAEGKSSRYYGVYKNMLNDTKQNKMIKNLKRFWDDEVIEEIEKGTIVDFILKKLCINKDI